ncbi:hypothetical protein AN641_07115 [Candidatus Epulonipiscioides gigas]|nr:hypothetical protein AN641_07115 [Epulopiscium sp. SCG-C07WGA-EpuloA2]
MLIIFLIIFFIKDIIYFNLMTKILVLKVNPKYYYLLSVINAICGLNWIFLVSKSILLTYSIMTLLYVIEICMLYKNTNLTKITMALTMIIHIMCFSAMTISVMGLKFKYSMNYIINDIELLTYSRILTLLLCIGIMLLLLKFIPSICFTKLVQNINKVKIFLTLELAAILAMVTSSAVYSITFFLEEQVWQQFIQGTAWFIIEYIGFFMLIGFEFLEEKKLEIENKMSLDAIYKNTVIEVSDIIIHVDCTEDKILNYILNGKTIFNLINMPYNKVILNRIDETVYESDKKKCIQMVQTSSLLKAFDEGKTNYSVEFKYHSDKTIDFKWFNANIILKKNDLSNKIVALIVINNIQNIKDLLHQTQIDNFSGLYNKSTTEKLINKHLQTKRDGILFLIDIDNFKQVNDKLGHNIGDIVIKEVSKTLTKIFKTADIIGRIGGDEFMVFIKNKNELDIIAKAQETCYCIKKTYAKGNLKVTISASIGVAKVIDESKGFNELYVMADKAMYHSKNSGKDKFTIFST